MKTGRGEYTIREGSQILKRGNIPFSRTHDINSQPLPYNKQYNKLCIELSKRIHRIKEVWGEHSCLLHNQYRKQSESSRTFSGVRSYSLTDGWVVVDRNPRLQFHPIWFRLWGIGRWHGSQQGGGIRIVRRIGWSQSVSIRLASQDASSRMLWRGPKPTKYQLW